MIERDHLHRHSFKIEDKGVARVLKCLQNIQQKVETWLHVHRVCKIRGCITVCRLWNSAAATSWNVYACGNDFVERCQLQYNIINTTQFTLSKWLLHCYTITTWPQYTLFVDSTRLNTPRIAWKFAETLLREHFYETPFVEHSKFAPCPFHAYTFGGLGFSRGVGALSVCLF